MGTDVITEAMEQYIANQEMSGGALIVRKNDQIVYDHTWGYADIANKLPVTDRTIYRMASMTKVVVGVAVMKMVEEGKIGLDDPVSKYLPAYANLRVENDPRYHFQENGSKLVMLYRVLTFRMEKVRSVPADRQITIRDLLSHASGLEQGIAGLIAMTKRSPKDTLEERVDKYSRFVLDFQPGTKATYSPCAGFDILGYILQTVSGKELGQYLKETVFDPLEMKDAAFKLTEAQKTHLARTYIRKNEKLVDVTGTKKDLEGILRLEKDTDYVAGCGGLYCTAKDYEHLARMLCNQGMYNGKQILKPDTVALMHTEAQEKHLEAEPGQVWGLSVRIRQDPVKAESACTAGTYGWSGAFGTHFFVSPEDDLEAVFVTCRADIGGSASYISKRVEELVFGLFANH